MSSKEALKTVFRIKEDVMANFIVKGLTRWLVTDPIKNRVLPATKSFKTSVVGEFLSSFKINLTKGTEELVSNILYNLGRLIDPDETDSESLESVWDEFIFPWELSKDLKEEKQKSVLISAAMLDLLTDDLSWEAYVVSGQNKKMINVTAKQRDSLIRNAVLSSDDRNELKQEAVRLYDIYKRKVKIRDFHSENVPE